MKITSFQKLYVHSLKDIFNAEKQIVKALPKMIKAATNPDLKTCFQDHLKESQEHVTRLERIFENMNMSGGRQKCKAMEGIINEAEDFMDSAESGSDVMDAGLIAAAQLIEHYEIASYGALVQFAKICGDNEAAKLLSMTLKEEKAADQKLTNIAEKSVNRAAAGQGSRRGGEPQQPSM